MIKIQGKKSRDIYFYDEKEMTVSDKEGNKIKLYYPLDTELDLSWELDYFFHQFYKLQNELKLYSMNKYKEREESHG